MFFSFIGCFFLALSRRQVYNTQDFPTSQTFFLQGEQNHVHFNTRTSSIYGIPQTLHNRRFYPAWNRLFCAIYGVEPYRRKQIMIPLQQKEIIFLDCETTGLDSDYHEIISVCIIRRNDGKTWTYKAKPEWPSHIDPKAVAVNGYTPSAWMDAISQEELAHHIGILLKDYIIVGHNPRFDIEFIRNLLWRYKIKTYIDPRAIDTTTLSYLYLVPYGLPSLSMDSIRKFLGWKVYPTHEALQDTKDVERLYNTLTSTPKRLALYLRLWVRKWRK